MADIAELIVALRLKDGVSPGLRNLNSQLGGMNRGLSQVGRGIGQVGSGLDRTLTRGAVAAGGALAFVANSAIQFEDAFTGVEKTVDASEAQLSGLSDEIRAMSREMPIAATELAGIAEQAGALGVAVSDIDEFTRTAALIGVTTDVSSDQAATALGQLSNVLGLTGQDYERFASTLVDLGNKGASTESQILEIATRAGAAGDLIGLSADQVLAFGSAAANLGIEAEAGGSALQKFFIDTLTNLQDDDLLGVMAETAGETGAAFKQAFEKDAAGALDVFLRGLGKLDEAAQIETLQSLGFNDVRITRLLLGFANNTDNLTESLDTAHAAFQANTAIQTEAERKFANTASQIKILKNNVTDAAITIGDELLPVITDLTKDFLGFLNQPETQRGLQEFAVGLAEGVRGLANELKGTDFSGIIGGVQLAAQVAKGAFDAFRSLPEPIQQLAIAALVANKVTGGAVGQIAAGLGNIVLGSLKTITAANVTVIGGNVTGGGLPGRIAGGAPIAGGAAAAGGITAAGVASLALGVVASAVAVKMASDFDAARDQSQGDLATQIKNLPTNTAQATADSISRVKLAIAPEGLNPLEQILFDTNVKPTLERGLADLKTVQQQQAIAMQAGNLDAQRESAITRNSVINEFRTGRAEQRERASQRAAEAAAAATSDRAMLNTASIQTQRLQTNIEETRASKEVARERLTNLATRYDVISGITNSKLDTHTGLLTQIAGKNFSPIIKNEVHNTVSSTIITNQQYLDAVASGGTDPKMR